MYDLTVIIPTFKEEANIRNIITEVDAVFKKNALNGEILVVDDNSPDHTIAIVNELKKTKANVSLLVRTSDHGLSQSVADGFLHASSEVFVVIDADFSHPPALIPKMYEEIRAGSDVVIGSRYMEGGGIRKWPLKRRVISLGATFMGRLLFPDITDPVSGFFAVRKSMWWQRRRSNPGVQDPAGSAGKGDWKKTRRYRSSSLTGRSAQANSRSRPSSSMLSRSWTSPFFLDHHESAAWQEWKKVFKFGLVGLSGILVNEGALIFLKEYAGLPLRFQVFLQSSSRS